MTHQRCYTPIRLIAGETSADLPGLPLIILPDGCHYDPTSRILFADTDIPTLQSFRTYANPFTGITVSPPSVTLTFQRNGAIIFDRPDLNPATQAQITTDFNFRFFTVFTHPVIVVDGD